MTVFERWSGTHPR